ncbi:hypothetical protein [Arthrobacter sp. UNC362MFTsu5.1]|nr:hypothetical protein [Arthrobacter sp. UNC362MFTsu5.1]
MSVSEISQVPADVLAYWTPERMEGAKPRRVRLPPPEADDGPSAAAEAD